MGRLFASAFRGKNLAAGGIVAGLAIVVGCGGGGGSSSSVTAPTGNAAVRAASLGSYQGLVGGMAFPNQVLRMTAPSTSKIGASPDLPDMVAKAMDATVLHSLGLKPSSRVLSYNSQLNVYSSTVIGTSQITITFFSDSSATTQIGTATITLPSGSTYPQTATATINLTGGNEPMNGTCKITFTGGTGANTLVGTLNFPKNKESLSVNLTLSSSLQVGGSMVLTENGQTITGTNVSGTLDQSVSCDVKLEPGGYSGTGTLDFLTNKIALTLTSAAGTATAANDGAGDVVITYPDKTTETVSTPSSAALLLTGNTTSSTTGTSTNTSAGGTATFDAPVDMTPNSTGYIGSAPDGYVVGSASLSSSYWKLPGAAGIALPSTGGIEYTGVSSNGQFIGIASGSPDQPMYLSKPNGTPVALKLPAGYSGGSPTSINASGVIVGSLISTNSSGSFVTVCACWPTPTSTPVVLKDPTGASIAGSVKTIINTGQILAYGAPSTNPTDNTLFLWPTYSSTPKVITDSTKGDLQGQVLADDGSIAFSQGATFDTSVPYFCQAPSYAPQAMQTLTGQSNASIVGMNASHQIVGYSINNCILWTSPTAKPVDFGTVVTSVEGDFPSAILDDGSIILNNNGAPNILYVQHK